MKVDWFNYARVLGTCAGICAVSVVMPLLVMGVMVKQELSLKAKLSIKQGVYVQPSPVAMSCGQRLKERD